MTMATSWSWVPNDQYKSSEELIHTLCKIVSRGGNFLLNVAPNPFGELDSTAYVRLREIGDWMKVNGSAIYESKPVFPYQYKNMVFTQKGNSIYVIILRDQSNEKLATEIELPTFKSKHKLLRSAKLLGNESIKIKLKNNKLFIPNAYTCQSSAAWVIQLN
jgi:alpha-L-fucosidase